MKRIETTRIHNTQRIHALANNAGPVATEALKPSTLIDHQIWDQEIWPDCLD